MKKERLILCLLIISSIFFEFFRDYIFINLNLQLNFLHYESLGFNTTNYTDTNVLILVGYLTSSSILFLKWGLTLLFAIIFFFHGLFFIRILWPNDMYFEFKKAYIFGGIVIVFLSGIFYLLYFFMNKNSNIYAVAIELSHFVQSILYPITFILAFYANNRIKN